MKNFLLRSAIFICLFAAGALPARADEPVNVDAKGVAIEGYDPVAFFTDHKPVKGEERFQSAYQRSDLLFRVCGAQGRV